MCNPMLFMAAATAVSAFGSMQQGRLARRAKNYEARVRENEAIQAKNIGIEKENIQREKTQQLISRQRARLGASGVELGTGTPFALQEGAAILGEADALRVRRNYDARAETLQAEAGLSRFEGEAAETAGQTRAFGQILGAAGQFAGSGIADNWFNSESAAVVGTPLGGETTFASYA